MSDDAYFSSSAMTHQWFSHAGEDCVRVPVECRILNKLQYRALSPSDITVVRDLCTQWFPVEYPEAWIREICTSERFYTRAFLIEDTIVAFIVAEVKPLKNVTKEERGILSSTVSGRTSMAYILSLGVKAEYRRQGLASRLLTLLLDDLGSDRYPDCLAVYLHVLTSNQAALRFYERHKFGMHSFLPYFYKIDGRFRDGFIYVYYVNGGRPSMGVLDYVLLVVSLLSPLSPPRLVRHLLRAARSIVSYMFPAAQSPVTVASLS